MTKLTQNRINSPFPHQLEELEQLKKTARTRAFAILDKIRDIEAIKAPNRMIVVGWVDGAYHDRSGGARHGLYSVVFCFDESQRPTNETVIETRQLVTMQTRPLDLAQSERNYIADTIIEHINASLHGHGPGNK